MPRIKIPWGRGADGSRRGRAAPTQRPPSGMQPAAGGTRRHAMIRPRSQPRRSHPCRRQTRLDGSRNIRGRGAHSGTPTPAVPSSTGAPQARVKPDPNVRRVRTCAAAKCYIAHLSNTAMASQAAMMAVQDRGTKVPPAHPRPPGGLDQRARSIEDTLSGDPGSQISMLLLVSDGDVAEAIRRAGPGVEIVKRAAPRRARRCR